MNQKRVCKNNPNSVPSHSLFMRYMNNALGNETLQFPLQRDGFPWSLRLPVKNLSAVQKTQVQSLGQENPLEKGMATHSSILTWRIPWTEEPWGRKESDTTEQLTLSLFIKGAYNFNVLQKSLNSKAIFFFDTDVCVVCAQSLSHI